MECIKRRERTTLNTKTSIAAACAAALMAASLVPAPALGYLDATTLDDGLVAATSTWSDESLQPGTFATIDDLTDGTYVFDSFTSSLSVLATNSEDGPAQAIVNGNTVTLVLDIYSPNRYDGLWAGRHQDAPADPSSASTVQGIMIPKGNYSGSTTIWTDRDGLVGKKGAEYKAVRFLMPLSKQDFFDMITNGADQDFYFAIRKAPWAATYRGRWEGNTDDYFTFGNLAKASDSTEVPSSEQRASMSDVKDMIDALPYNTFNVTKDDGPAILAAQAAFEQLPDAQQAQLDTEEARNGSYSYGRTLECALWGLRSLDAVDNSTTLKDGTYTGKVTTTCNMGKSTSSRNFKFKVVKVTVKDGHAMATLQHDTASPYNLKSGGLVFTRTNAKDTDKATFEIPIDLNSTFYVSQLAKGTSNTLPIPYELTTAIDETNTEPDPVVVPAGGEASGDNTTGGAKGTTSSPAAASAAKGPSAPTVGAAATAAPTAATAASAAAAEQAAGTADDAKRTANNPATAGNYDVASTADKVRAVVDYLSFAGAGTVALVVVGAAAFALNFRRRNNKPISLQGTGLAEEHA